MKHIYLLGFVVMILTVVRCQEDNNGEWSRDKRTPARIGCKNGGFVCRLTGYRGLSCGTTGDCSSCQIKKSPISGASLDLYCNDGSNPNAYARCQVVSGSISCIA